MKKKCAKCGTAINPKHNNQKYCYDCSRWMRPKIERPRLACPVCGKPTGRLGGYNRKYDNIDKTPCDDFCENVLRKEKEKSERNHQIARKKYLKAYGKFLIERFEECGKQDWTPMRYVSESEIKESIRRYNLYAKYMNYRNHVDHEYGKTSISILRGCPYTNVEYKDDDIERAGYYRVDPIGKWSDDQPWWKTGLCFHRRYSGGIALSGRSTVEQMFQKQLDEKRNQAFKRLSKRRKEKAVEELQRNEFLKEKHTHQSKQFFQTIAMAAAVGNAIK